MEMRKRGDGRRKPEPFFKANVGSAVSFSATVSLLGVRPWAQAALEGRGVDPGRRGHQLRARGRQAHGPFPTERTKDALKRCGHASLWEWAPPPAAAGPSRLHFCFSSRQEGSPPDAPFHQPDPRSTRWEGPQGVASTPHLPKVLLALIPPVPSVSIPWSSCLASC